MTEQILLNKNKSKTSTNYNNSLAIQLKGSKRILPCDPMETTINEIDVYNQERENCSKIRFVRVLMNIMQDTLVRASRADIKRLPTDYHIRILECKSLWQLYQKG